MAGAPAPGVIPAHAGIQFEPTSLAYPSGPQTIWRVTKMDSPVRGNDSGGGKARGRSYDVPKSAAQKTP